MAERWWVPSHLSPFMLWIPIWQTDWLTEFNICTKKHPIGQKTQKRQDVYTDMSFKTEKNQEVMRSRHHNTNLSIQKNIGIFVSLMKSVKICTGGKLEYINWSLWLKFYLSISILEDFILHYTSEANIVLLLHYIYLTGSSYFSDSDFTYKTNGFVGTVC